MEKPQVFISHAWDDADWGRSFAQALRQHGLTVYIDDFEGKSGETRQEALETNLRNSDVLVALWDSKRESTPNVYFELGAAIAMGKRVVAVVPKDVDPTVLPLKLRWRRYLIRDTPEKTAEELSSTLKAA
jgi:nucleoside 2-deoxyribosyltransferase